MALSHQKVDSIRNKVIYCFWTGTNQMSNQRLEAIKDLFTNTGCHVMLITPHNLSGYIVEGNPLHPAYEYLSETHKADYLRTYFMHFYGGGYSDIKRCGGEWGAAFDIMIQREELFLNGYHEESPGDVAGGPSVQEFWREIPGNGAYIVRPNTDFTREWYGTMIRLLDEKLEEFRKHPATHPQSHCDNTPGYPIGWNEMLGRIFHPVSSKYRHKLHFTVPKPICSYYR